MFTEFKKIAASRPIQELVEDEVLIERALRALIEEDERFSESVFNIRFYSLPQTDDPELEAIRAEQMFLEETFALLDLKKSIEKEVEAHEESLQKYAEAIVGFDPSEPRSLEQAKEMIHELRAENQELKDQVEYSQRVAGIRIAGVLLICLFAACTVIIRGLKKGTKQILDS